MTALESNLNTLYISLPDESICLSCSFATRLQGFLDIILSGFVMSSHEAQRLLGDVHSHRGATMGGPKYYSLNDYISFSTGFVSFKYSDTEIRTLAEYVGGYGVFVPLQDVLRNEHIGFSHCSRLGGITNYDLNRGNIVNAVHMARKQGKLFDDGYGNVFEVSLDPVYCEGETGLRKTISCYPRLDLGGNVKAFAPLSEKDGVIEKLLERQNRYRLLYEKIKDMKAEEIAFQTVLGVNFDHDPEPIKKFIPSMLSPIDVDILPVDWYPERNLNDALKRASVLKK